MAFLALALLHGWLCLRAFPVFDGDLSLPFLNHDHTFHFYYAWLASQQGSPNPACYDPYFMAGYVKSLWFPTSSTYPEIIGWLTGGCALAYRLYVWSGAWMAPLMLGMAALAIGRSLLAMLIGTGLGILWFWTAFPVTYVTWGMVAFILTSSTGILGASLLLVWLSAPTAPRAVLKWTGGVILLALSQIGHPSTAITSGAILTAAFVAACRRLRVRDVLWFWLTPVLVLVLWSPWLLPVLALRETCGSLATGFINYNLLGRMIELATARFPTESALLLAGVTALVTRRGDRDPVYTGIAVGAVALFFLGYVGAAIPELAFLQPGRYTQPFYALMVLAISVYLPAARRSWATTLLRGLAYGVAASLLLFSTFLQTPSLFHPRLVTRLPEHVIKLVEVLRSLPPHAGRLLFEEIERRETLARFGLRDPSSGLALAALLPTLTSHQVIGGPYLYTHLITNGTNFGDGRLLNDDVESLTPRDFREAVQRYNVAYVAAWSPPVVAILQSRGDLYEHIATCGLYRVYRVRQPAGWTLRGKARVSSQPNTFTLSDVSPHADGVIVLKYHWMPGLRSSVGEVFPVNVAGDPVPFVGLRVGKAVESARIQWKVPSLLRP